MRSIVDHQPVADSSASTGVPVVIVGPTASGKSDVAMAYAATDATVEIVAVDSMQVYRGMDIGTAKPTAADRCAVVHHCLDLVAPSADFAVAEYAAAAHAALRDIATRRRRALLVAGTGLYLRSVTDPMEMPGRWPSLRSALDVRCQTEGSAVLHAELARLDPLAASRMEPTNVRRIVRALEVVHGSGRAFSSFGPGLNRYPKVEFTFIGLRWPRSLLAARIAGRVAAMMDAGLLGEVDSLAAAPGGLSRSARQALGYKELLDHLEGNVSLDQAITTIISRTTRFAVRQERWFRRDPRIRWTPLSTDPIATVVPMLARVAS